MLTHLRGNVWVVLFCSSHVIHLLLLPYSFCMYINKWHPMQIYPPLHMQKNDYHNDSEGVHLRKEILFLKGTVLPLHIWF